MSVYVVIGPADLFERYRYHSAVVRRADRPYTRASITEPELGQSLTLLLHRRRATHPTQYLLDVILGLGIRRHAPVLIHRSGPGIVGR